LLKLRAAEEVAATDHDGDLYPSADYLGDLAGDLRHHVGIKPDLPPAEHLAAEFEQHP
jgi:hypothetical protein